jgi:hypothetical protein
MLDDRRRLAERSARVSDPGALVRFVTEEGRLEDHLAKLDRLVKDCQRLKRDRSFDLSAMGNLLRYACATAKKRAQAGEPPPGCFLARTRDGQTVVWRYTEPAHALDFDPFDVDVKMKCRTCGAVDNVRGRCVVDVTDDVTETAATGDAEPVTKIDPDTMRPENAGMRQNGRSVTWWNGSTTSRRLQPTNRGSLMRHRAVCYWDDVAGVCGVELATGLVRERPATFFPILKGNEQEHGQRIDADTWHAWLLESHPRRVVMLTSYVLGPARGTDTPLWQGALRGRP